MKEIIFLCTIMLVIPFNATRAQSNREDDREKQDDDSGNRLGNVIEKFVDRITNVWNFEDSERVAQTDTIPKKKHRSLTIEDTDVYDNAQTFAPNKVIEEGDTINNDVVVKGGDLTVAGTINGSVLVVGGDLRVKSTGRIAGDAHVRNGNIIKEQGAVIGGYEDKTNSVTSSYRESRSKFIKSGHTFNVPWLSEQTNLDNFIFRYNRVEGIFLGIGIEKKYYWEGERNWNAYGSVGWGFKSHTWRGNLGLSRQFAFPSDDGHHIIEIGTDGYSLTDTKDQWIIGQLENSLAAILIHEDFRDYFERTGMSVHAAYYSQTDYKTELKIEYRADTYDSLTNNVNWALFGGEKSFRSNPVIQPGVMRSMIVSGGLSTITKTTYSSKGWSFYALGEFAKKGWGSDSDFDFDQYMLDVRCFQPLGRYDNINVRMRVGTAGGPLPLQKSYELGGLGTLNAFPFKSEIGNRMVLINAEYIISGSFLDELDFWPTWLLQHFNFILISDAGFTRSMGSNLSPLDGFDKITWNEFKHDFGVALGNRSGSFRIGVAWRTDTPKPAQFILRISRPF